MSRSHVSSIMLKRCVLSRRLKNLCMSYLDTQFSLYMSVVQVLNLLQMPAVRGDGLSLTEAIQIARYKVFKASLDSRLLFVQKIAPAL
jgi:hypothetical protein